VTEPKTPGNSPPQQECASDSQGILTGIHVGDTILQPGSASGGVQQHAGCPCEDRFPTNPGGASAATLFGSAANGALYDFLTPPQEPDEIGRLGPYRILRVLGEGGMGIVFQAEDTQLQRPVALKVMKPQMLGDLAARTRFLREARAAAAIKHDHIVTIYQVGHDNDIPYLAMEFLDGESLECRLIREDRLPIGEVLRIGREIAEGLAAAHERKLIHRDIKPANLWLEGPCGRVKILDFGLARPALRQTNLTATGLIVGTPNFMSPEQARGEELDHRSDLFSLGCVLYSLCAGRPPFGGESVMAILTSLAVDEPRPVRELNTEVPHELSDLISRLLAKDREQRPASAHAVIESIKWIEKQMGCHESSPLRIPGAHRKVLLRRFVGVATVLLVMASSVLLWGALSPGESRETARTPDGVATIRPSGPSIRVGILLPTSGTLAVSGEAVLDATVLAFDEINERGGVLGRPVEPIIRDTQSSPAVCALQAENLISEERVCTLFGIWSSANRKTVRPIVEKHDHLLFYPVQYEGLEQSPNIVYCGAAPNQQIIPAVKYCYGFLGKRRFFLVGSDYVFPRTANAIIREELKTMGALVVGEEYLLLGSSDVRQAISKIVGCKPDMILSTINGNSNNSFFHALREAGIGPNTVPTLSFSIAEQELRSLNLKEMIGDYAAWNYFQSVDRPQNREFVRRFQARYGSQRVVTDPMEAGYFSVYLWAQAVESAGRDEPRAIRKAVKNQCFDAPGGLVRIDPETQHAWKTFRLGKIIEGGQFEIIWSSEKPIRPEPFPSCRSREAWDQFLTRLYQDWDCRWEKPGS
jgi:urea transport system substrate-binding protein